MRVAVIDLGTNTFNLIIAEIMSGGGWKELYSTKMPVKLGEGGIEDRRIIPTALNRAVGALIAYKKIINSYGVNKTKAFATSAVRGAKNQKEFINTIHQKCGIDVVVLSGEQEAEYIYYGVKEALDLSDELSLIMDIGGGSTEFIIANKHGIVWKHSFLLGVSRLKEKYKPSDPISEKEVQKLNRHFETRMAILADALKQYPVTRLIGSSGSFDTFADIIVSRFHNPGDIEGKSYFHFNISEYEAVHKDLLIFDRIQRMRMKGMLELRVDMIVIASVHTYYVLKRYDIKDMWLSTYSLKEGVIASLMSSA